MSNAVRSPAFVAGLCLRLVLLLIALPIIHIEWFEPFLSHAVANPSMDPWTSFMASGGDPQAFPYGLVYILTYAPGVAIGSALAGSTGALLAIAVTTLFLDTGLYFLVRKLAGPTEGARASAVYWLSPISLYIGYWHGQLDVLPVLLLTAGFVSLKSHQFRWAAYLTGVAVAAKASMIVAIPFILIYLIGSSRLRGQVFSYVLPFAFTLAALLVPFSLQPGFRSMVLSTPELSKATELTVNYGGELSLFLFPIALGGLLFVAWRIRRLNFEAVIAFTAVAFLLLFCLTPASPGWALWFVPFLSLHLAKAEGWRTWLIYGAFSIAFVVFHMVVSQGAVFRLAPDISLGLSIDLGRFGGITSWLLSGLVLLGVILLIQVLREQIFDTQFHRATRRPMVISIAGDSGTGKDTLSDLIVDVLGAESSTTVSGDDYHIWDRNKPMWRALTHLNPKANHLDQFTADVRALAANKPVRMRHYDHSVGRMTKPLQARPSDTVIVSGLHALYPRALVELTDLRVFLDMDEGLRRFLKVRRDVTKRGHPIEKVLGALEKREADRNSFVLPQAAHADLILSLAPARSADIEDFDRDTEDLPLKLRLVSRRAQDFSRLSEILISVCGVFLVERNGDDNTTELTIEGHPSPKDIAIAARYIAPGFEDHIALQPEWHGGINGLLQLAMLDQMARVAVSRAGGTSWTL